MKRQLLYVAIASLFGGCSFAPGCYVGVSILPPGPFVHCGLDASPKAPAEPTEGVAE